jgi:two-component sensor histidine kinase
MTASSSDPARNPERYLAHVFGELTAAGTLDASVRIAARAASELADADGLCLVSPAGEHCVVALAQREQIYLCDLRGSDLYRASARRMLWGKEDSIPLHTGEHRRIGVALLVPLQPTTGYAAIGFFWQPGRNADLESTRKLELLARALGLAACGYRKDEEHVARQREQQRITADLQHRLRNNLAVLRSIIRRSRETADSAEHFALHLEARIGALARMQGTLAAIGKADVELEDLIRTELNACAVAEQRYLLQGPAVRLHSNGAESVGLAVHELATNSLKFGALGASSGFLAVSWTVIGGSLPRLRVRWVESGVHIVSVAPRRRGFGQELIECTLPYELGARTSLAFNPGGVVCEIVIPLEACATSVEPAAQQRHGGGSR